MTCCASSLRLQHGAGAKITYQPGRGFSFAEVTPQLRIWQGDGNAGSPLLTVGLTETPKGSRFALADGAMLLELTAGDVGDLPAGDDLFFDITLADVSGFVSPFVGGPVTVEADGSAGPASNSGSVTVALGGLQVPVVIQGGSLGPAMSTAMADLNQAVSDAETAANDAEAAKNATISALGTKLDRSADLSDLSDKEAATGNLLFQGRSLASKLGDVVSVKDFGVVGDGTDETAAIQAAIDAVEDAGGGFLLFPACAEFYGFTSLTVGHRVTLVGQGFTEWAGAPPSGYLKRVSGSTGVGITVTGDGAGLANIHIDGADLGTDLVQVLGGRFTLRDTSLVQAGQDNLRIGTDETSHSYNMNLWRVFNPILLDAGRYGLHVHDADDGGTGNDTNVNAGMLVGCDIRGCASNGIHSGKAWDNLYIQPGVQNCGGTGFRIAAGSRNTRVIAPYLEGNGNSEAVIDAGAYYTVLEGNRSNVVSSGYVDNGSYSLIQETRDSVPAWFWRDAIAVGKPGSGGEPRFDLYGGPNDILQGSLVGRDGDVGSAGEVAIQVKRNGNTPVDRLRLTDGAVVVPTGTDLRADKLSDQSGNQLVGSRVTGFEAMTGTATKTAIATYTAPDMDATYNETQIQALADAVQALSRRVKAMDDALLAGGLPGA